MTDLIREFSATKVQRLGFIKFTSKYRKVFDGRGVVRMVLRGGWVSPSKPFRSCNLTGVG